MWKKIPIAGAPTPIAARNCGKLRANGCGTCVSHLEKRCRERNYASSNGHYPKTRHSFGRFQNPHQTSMAPGNWLETEAEPVVKLPGRRLCGKRTGSCAVLPGLTSTSREVRQENSFTQRAVYLAYSTDCQPCALREQCLAKGG